MAVIGIYDKEESYAESFAEYLMWKKVFSFEIRAFSRQETLEEYAGKNYIDILLVSKELLNESVKGLNAGKIILLTSEDKFAEESEYPCIYKYKSAKSILSEILNYYTGDGEETFVGGELNEGCEVIGVYSPAPCCEKTSFSFVYGQILAENQSVLYINMEEFSGFTRIFEKGYALDLSDLVYFYRQNPQGISAKLKAMVSTKHNLDYVPSMLYSPDLRNITSKEWTDLIRLIVNNTEYSTIILDLSSMVKDVFDILEVCTKIYVPVKEDKLSLARVAEMDEFLMKTEREDIAERLNKVVLPETGDDVSIENYIDTQLWGSMGNYIRSIMEGN